jgi:hypothetical protein
MLVNKRKHSGLEIINIINMSTRQVEALDRFGF